MSWQEGEILGFDGNRPGDEKRRKIRSRRNQPWRAMHFFYLSQALDAGYTHEQLQPGRRIRFLPGSGPKGPIVKRFAPPPAGESSPTHFLNPYHFIPLLPPPEDTLVPDETLRESWDLHGRFGRSFDPPEGEAARFSGRVVCRITTRGPVVVGGEQRAVGEEGEGTRVEPFELATPGPDGNVERRPAIPGSTLRGMISAIVEAASCSAMRVLGDATYTRRERTGRRPVPGSLHQSVREGISEDLVPFNRGRSQTTLAERLFGYVERDGQRALAGRVRFAHALAVGEPPPQGWYEPELTLAILASPKPPCPAFYFDDRQGRSGYLSKSALDLARHLPKGRKAYLHHRRADLRAKPYAVDRGSLGKLERRVRPLKKGISFLSHIDFVNLTREELGFLLYGLEPAESHRHKLGMGKPLGLGHINLDTLALCFVDRPSAYGVDQLWGPKYQAVESGLGRQELEKLGGELAGRYRDEHESAVDPVLEKAFPARAELIEETRRKVPTAIRDSIETLGDPDGAEAEVTYPRLLGQRGSQEHFRWFVENDGSRIHPRDREFLDSRQPLKTLRRHRRS